MYHGNGIHFTSQRLVATSAHCMSETLDKLQIVHSCTTPNNETDGRVGQIMVDIGNRARNKPCFQVFTAFSLLEAPTSAFAFKIQK